MLLLLALLPAGPTVDHTGTSGMSALGQANQFVPVAEALTLLPVAAALAVVGLYKLAKFIRGGG